MLNAVIQAAEGYFFVEWPEEGRLYRTQIPFLTYLEARRFADWVELRLKIDEALGTHAPTAVPELRPC